MALLAGLCDELLDSAVSDDGHDLLHRMLARLVERVGAEGGGVVLHGADGTRFAVAWHETTGRAGPCDDLPAAAARAPAAGRTEGDGRERLTIPIGSVQGCEACLVLLAGPAGLDPAVSDLRPRLASLFRLVLERHLWRERCARLDALAELSGDWIWETDEEGRLIRLSQDPRRLGLDPALLFGRRLDEILDGPGARDGPGNDDLRAAIRGRRPFRDILHAVTLPGGERLWLRSRGVPRFGPGGSFAGFTGVSAEVTGLAAETREDRMAAERLDAFLRAIPHLAFEITADGRYTDFIVGPERLMAAARDTLPGRTMEEVLPADVAAGARRALDEVMRTGSCAPFRYRLETLSGPRWFSLTGARKPPAVPGEAATAVFVVIDVTEEEEQTEALFRMSSIVEAMTNMVVVVDVQSRVVWANAAWEQRLGWRLDEVRGKELGPIVRPPGEDPENAAAVSAAMAEGRSYHGQTVNMDRHGNRFWLDFNILPLRDRSGALVGYVSVETDITPLRDSQRIAAEAAAAAERARAQLHNAIEALPDGVVIWDAENRLVDVNSAYKRMYPHVADELVPGVSQEHVLRVGLARRAFPSAWGREEEWLAEQWDRYRTPTVDEVQRADGAWIRRLDLRTADGGRIAVRIDTTERRAREEALEKANAALLEARAALARILEAANIGTWDWLVGTETLRIDGRYLEMLGYGPADWSSFDDAAFRSLVHPDDLARLDADHAANFTPSADGGERNVEQVFRMRHRDGSWVWILSRSAVTERNPDGSPRRIVGVHIDITERRKLEAAIEENRNFLDAVMEASVAAIAVLSADGTITFANAEAERILGLERRRIAGRRYDDPSWQVTTLEGEPVPPEAMPFRLALDSGRPVRDIRHAIMAQDGKRRILSISAAPFRREGGAGEVMVATSFIDITADIERAALLEQALEDAREASRSKSTFLANMSHEIRTPLNGVLGMAEILDGLVTEPRQKEMIGTIRRSGELLLNVLNDILDMSKIEAGKMVLESIPLVPADLARAVERLHTLRAQEKGLGLEVFINSGASQPRLGDPTRIQQILNNLMSNAVKFTERGWVALLVSARPGQPLVLEVRDSGIGMTAEQLGRVFDSFEQAEAGTTRRYGGTGLGMAIVKRLVGLMGGEVEVRSEVGKGTDVRVVLPLPEVEAAASPAPPGPPPPRNLRLEGVQLLLADDSETNRKVLAEMLKDTGATMTFAVNGAEAVAAFDRLAREGRRPDLLILDIAMPEMDGKEALAAIRARPGGDGPLPAIALTANAMPHQVAEYIMAGFDAHVPKPFRRADLIRAVETLLPARGRQDPAGPQG